MNKYSEFEKGNEKKIDFQAHLFKFIAFWKWFVVSLVFCLIVAVIYLKFALPGYEVTTSILLKDDVKGGGSMEMNLIKELGLYSQKNNVDNELEVLNKSILMEQVVRELGIYASYTKLGTFGILKQFGVEPMDTQFGSFREKILYGSECPVLVRLPEPFLTNMNKIIEFDILTHPYGVYEFIGVYKGEKYNVKASISDNTVLLPFGKVNITRGNFRPAEDMVMKVVLVNPMIKANQIMGQLKMDLTSKFTSVVNITFMTSNVRLGQDLLKKMVEIYNRNDRNDQNVMANTTAKFIDERLMTLTRELGDVESKVENYKQNQGLTDIKSESDMFIQQTGDFTQKRFELETQLAIITDLDEYLHKKENRYQLIPASSSIKSQGLIELINNYNRLLLQRNRLSRIATNSNQAMIDLTTQIESVFGSVQSSVRNEKKNLQIGQQDLLSKNRENAAHIRAIPRQEREYTEIKRQQGVKEGLFLFLLQKKEENYLKMSMVEPLAKLIDNVNGGDPISPKNSMILLISILFGLGIPVIGILIRDLLRYQIENKKELEGLTSIPVLGEILKNKQSNKVILHENSTDSFTELVRLLRTNLLFVLDTPDKKVINIVSSISGEGKTTVAINLAISLALLDKKVLILCLDIRKPTLDVYLGLENTTGITMFLSGHMPQNELVKPSGVHPDLYVITAGPIPPNPSELLAKPSLDKLVSDLRTQFDYIVIDTAPLQVVSDSFSLNRLADVNLYVVRADFTPKRNIEEAAILFAKNKLKNMYFVLNDVDSRKNTLQYGYGKKYVYGYGNDDDKKKGNK